MNVKFKMPKFGRTLTGNGMMKELLLTTLATSISIVLTFGTAHLIEQRHAEQMQRQTAMMLIHDIDASANILDVMAEGEEKQKTAIQYVIDHLDQIESLPEDTLSTAMSMLGTIFTDINYFDDSKEKIFNSSQDTWKNLDDVPFVDNMESFYRSRQYMEDMMSQSPQWKYPVTQEDYYDLMVRTIGSGMPPQQSYAAVLKEKLKDPKIRYYIDFSAHRARFFRRYAQYWRSLSDRNKFIMNIDDEELAEYVRKSQRSGRSVSKSDIIGQWEYIVSGKDIQYYDFTKRDSFSAMSKTYYANPFYSGEICVTYSYGGTWDIQGDSLVMNHAPECCKVVVDRSGVSYRAEMRDSVESFINRHFQEDNLLEWGKKRFGSKKNTTLEMSINKAGDKIELSKGGSENPENARFFYLKRSTGPTQKK